MKQYILIFVTFAFLIQIYVCDDDICDHCICYNSTENKTFEINCDKLKMPKVVNLNLEKLKWPHLELGVRVYVNINHITMNYLKR